MRLVLAAIIILLSGCSNMAVDYHLAKLSETTRVSNQNYHVKRIHELAGPDSAYNVHYKDRALPPRSFTQGFGGFTTSHPS